MTGEHRRSTTWAINTGEGSNFATSTGRKWTPCVPTGLSPSWFVIVCHPSTGNVPRYSVTLPITKLLKSGLVTAMQPLLKALCLQWLSRFVPGALDFAVREQIAPSLTSTWRYVRSKKDSKLSVTLVSTVRYGPVSPISNSHGGAMCREIELVNFGRAQLGLHGELENYVNLFNTEDGVQVGLRIVTPT